MTVNLVNEIAKELFNKLSKEDLEVIKDADREEMYIFHHGVGTSIRNGYGLWTTSPLTEQYRIDRVNGGTEFIENGVDCHPHHPDSVSMEILFKIWELSNES